MSKLVEDPGPEYNKVKESRLSVPGGSSEGARRNILLAPAGAASKAQAMFDAWKAKNKELVIPSDEFQWTIGAVSEIAGEGPFEVPIRVHVCTVIDSRSPVFGIDYPTGIQDSRAPLRRQFGFKALHFAEAPDAVFLFSRDDIRSSNPKAMTAWKKLSEFESLAKAEAHAREDIGLDESTRKQSIRWTSAIK
jgi:hypothetical protein